MLNVVAITGRLVRTPELKQTTTGKDVCSFTVACDRSTKDQNGNYQSDFFDCVSFGKTAEFICKYFSKGNMIALDGRLQTRKYTDKSGNNRTATEIIVGNVNFCGKQEKTANTVEAKDDDFEPISEDGDLPF